MRPLRYMLFALLICLATGAFSQSDAQKTFARLKTLAGSWTGTYEGGTIYVSIRVTSTGSASSRTKAAGVRYRTLRSGTFACAM